MFASVNGFVLAPVVALGKPPEGFVGDIVTDGVRGDARFDGPASALGCLYGMYRYVRGVLALLGLVVGRWRAGAFCVPWSLGIAEGGYRVRAPTQINALEGGIPPWSLLAGVAIESSQAAGLSRGLTRLGMPEL